MNRHLIVTLLAIMLLATAACDNAGTRGENAAARLAEAWADDSLARDFADSYAALADSLTFPWSASMMNSAFVEASARLSDTLGLAAEVIARGTDVAAERAESLVDDLSDGKIDADQACDRIALMGLVTNRLGRDSIAGLMEAEIDRLADALPLQRQMELYARITDPETLARALTEDRKAPGADLGRIDRQAGLLREIYNDSLRAIFDHIYSTQQ